MACSLFGISDDISMQVVAVGFIIGVVQDSVETALNSSSDLLLSASAEIPDSGDLKGKRLNLNKITVNETVVRYGRPFFYKAQL